MDSEKREKQVSSIPYKDSHFRSVLKSLTWRVVATTTTFLAAYWVTEDVDWAIKIGVLEFITKTVTYYLHERMWVMFPPRGAVKKSF